MSIISTIKSQNATDMGRMRSILYCLTFVMNIISVDANILPVHLEYRRDFQM